MDADVNESVFTIDILQQQSRRYSFFQALREIESTHSKFPRVGHAASPTQEAFRLRQPADLGFAPSTLDEANIDDQGRLVLDQRFFGLLGPSGPLPVHLTEIVRNRARHADDDALQSFLDIFHHRMVTLFYRAWSQARPAIQRDRPSQDRFAMALSGLFGMGMKHSRGRDSWPDETKQFFAGHLGPIRRHAEGLESILKATVEAPVSIHPFALRWLKLSSQETTRIGGHRSQKSPISPNGLEKTELGSFANCLGRSTVLGSRVPDRQSLFEVHIGPISYPRFESLMPHRNDRQRLEAIVKNHAGLGIDARVRVTLRKEEVPRPQLGASGRLGRDAWLQSRPIEHDVDDYCFETGGMNIPHSTPTLGVSS